MPVAAQNILPRKNDFLVRNPDIDAKADDAWKRDGHGDRMEQFSLLRFYQFCFSQKKQHDGFSDIAHAHRFIILIQHQYFAVESTEHSA